MAEFPPPEYSHPIYPRMQPEHADGVAWLFLDKDHFGKYFYKLPDLGPTEIRIRSMYAGLCHSDCMEGRSLWEPNQYPLCPGHEIVGEVIAVGHEVTKVKLGEVVAFGPIRKTCGKCDVCVTGETELCMALDKKEFFIYGKYFGGWASHQQHDESHCYKIPEGLDVKDVAPLMCAGVTVLKPMVQHLKKGQKIAIVGVGGLGHLAVQYAVKLGLQVDAFESGVKENKESLVKKLGAQNVYKWTDKKVLEGLKGQYDALLHTVSEGVDADLMDKLLATMKKGGKILLIGLPPNSQKFQMTYYPMFVNQWSILGSCCGGRKATEFMLEFTRDHGVQCKSEHYNWEDFPKALDKLENGTPKFRGVVDMDKFTKDFAKNIKHVK